MTWPLGLGCSNVDLSLLHPTPEQFAVYWRLYKEKCYPIIRIFHLPTVEPVILHCQGQRDGMPRTVEALLFAIYFSTVVSLHREECLDKIGSEESTLIRIYKAGMEQALARARLFDTDQVTVLEAFVVFLCSRRNCCNLRLMWSLTSMVARLAHGMGIHRDGPHFGLSPFVTETRRRLWWVICVLECRAAEALGYHASTHTLNNDAQMPRNINDADFGPGTASPLASRGGFTEMAYVVIMFQATVVESHVLLFAGLPTAKWSWFCCSPVEWYAIAYILTELCVRTRGELVDRAWEAVTSVLEADRPTRPLPAAAAPGDMVLGPNSQPGSLSAFEYKRMNKLLRTARAGRRGRPQSPGPAMPSRPGPADLLVTAHRFNDGLISGAADPIPASVNHCDCDTSGREAVSADYVRDHLSDISHEHPFDGLLYGPSPSRADTLAEPPLPDYLSDKGPAPPDTL
ncbi:uncharacterized protein MAM_07622 [Metarhizium album ARSEF 1941]|uniref:Transcription factor, fungi n=1 Tax=Metarhizium album (strain ARSEF 1941) TaxID=1081103 RepID=A0A0B2WM48_METAS|nr:uncharacterized protein MAM_07622 [Metarhizium album ARSEF 1941]KHN94567.1 Transcription factor, fungi [Metarhizium album ARSEF 1941]